MSRSSGSVAGKGCSAPPSMDTLRGEKLLGVKVRNVDGCGVSANEKESSCALCGTLGPAFVRGLSCNGVAKAEDERTKLIRNLFP